MRLNNYLNEQSVTPEQFLKDWNYLKRSEKLKIFNDMTQQVEKNCMPFLRELRKRKESFLYSGRKASRDALIHKQVRTDRKPKDTPEKIHNLLDAEFKKQTGIALRSNSVFCTPDVIEAKKYGTVYVIFPVGGNYQLWHNPKIKDLWGKMIWIYDASRKYDIYTQEKEELAEFFQEIVSGYKKGFPPNNVEVMLHCKEYMGISWNWIKDQWMVDEFQNWIYKDKK